MSNPVTVKTEVIITVPVKLWPRIAKALAAYHNERYKHWGDRFCTHSDRCNFDALHRIGHIFTHQATADFLMQAHLHMPVPFTGEITFLKAGTEP